MKKLFFSLLTLVILTSSLQTSFGSKDEEYAHTSGGYRAMSFADVEVSLKAENTNLTFKFNNTPPWPANSACSQRAHMQVISIFKRRMGAVLGIIGTAGLAAGFDHIISDRLEKRNTLNNLLKEFNNAEIRNQKIIDECNFEMINDSSLYTERKYLPSYLETTSKALNQRIISTTHLEESIQNFSKSIIWRRFLGRDLARSADQLLLATLKQKSHLQIIYYINDTLYHIQRKNYTSQSAVPTASSLIKQVNAQLKSHFKAYYHSLVEKDQNYLSSNTQELEEFSHLLKKTLNLQGIIQRRLAKHAEDLGEIKRNLNLSLESYNTIIRDSPQDARIANVYCNKGYLAYSWLGKFEEGRSLLAQAHQLYPSNPMIMMHRAICEYRAYSSLKSDPLSPSEESLEKPPSLRGEKASLERAEFLITEAAKRAPTNYLIRRTSGQLMLKFGLENNAHHYYKGALHEFDEIELFLKEGKLDICDLFDHYYYYLLAQACAANNIYTESDRQASLSTKEKRRGGSKRSFGNHALGNLMKAKIYFKDNVKSTAFHNISYFKKIDYILQTHIQDIETQGRLNNVTSFLREDINYPFLRDEFQHDRTLDKILSEPTINAKDQHSLSHAERINILLAQLQTEEKK